MIGRGGAHLLDSLFHSDFISNPLKRMIVEGLGVKDPAVLQKINDYIEKNSPDIKDLGEEPQPQNLPPKSQNTKLENKTANNIIKKGIKNK
jgi:hypothetical protein